MRSKTYLLKIVPAILAGLLSTVPFTLAQPNPEKSSEPRPAPRGERPQFGGFQGLQAGRYGLFFERVLTEEQRTSLRDAMEQNREKMRGIEDKLRDARRDLLQASMSQKFDEDRVRQKALEVGNLDAELTVLRAKALSQMKPALTAEQLEKIKNPPPFEGGEFRRDFRRDESRESDRKPRGPRDENDLPPKPKPEN